MKLLAAGVVFLALWPSRGSAVPPDAGAAARPPIRTAAVSTILAEARASQAPAVLVNVWATWCDPCREELPDLLRFYRAHRETGLRLVLLSADEPDAGAQVAAALAQAAAQAGFPPQAPLDAIIYLKEDPDMKLIDALDPRWSGALPATFLFDGAGRRVRSWLAPITSAELERDIGPRLTKSRGEAKTRARRKP